MFCPGCGAESDGKARYCSSCGAALATAERRSFGDRLRSLAGPTPTARVLTIGTAVAIVGAIGAFLALPTSETNPRVPQDAYTHALDASCVQSKADIAASQRRSLATRGLSSVARNADELVVIAAQWRSTLRGNPAPSDRLGKAQALQQALEQVEIQAGALSRAARTGSQPSTIRQAGNVDKASAEVERSIAGLALSRCSGLKVRLGAVVKR